MSVVSGVMGASSSKAAAQAQANAARYSADRIYQATQEKNKMIQDMWQTSRDDTAPWREEGEAALTRLSDKITAGPGEFKESEGYQFRLAEGEKAIERAMAARGMNLSGATLKALDTYNQNVASGERQNWLNEYYQSLTPDQSLAGLGQTSATNTAASNQQAASSIAANTTQGTQNYVNMLMNGANASAAGMINSANALSGISSGLVNGYGVYKMLNQPSAQTTTTNVINSPARNLGYTDFEYYGY